VAEQPPHAIGLLVCGRCLTALANGRPGKLRAAADDDAKRLAGGVVVGREDLVQRALSFKGSVDDSPRR